MDNVIIAFDNAPGTSLRTFYESCADEVRQFCYDNEHSFISVFPPDLTHANVIDRMSEYSICFIAAHGSSDAIYNEEDAEIVSTHTTNYNLSDKVLYSVSCLCAINLGPELKRIGLNLFVGYKDVFRVGYDEDAFKTASTSGIKAILEGSTFFEAKQRMLKCYDDCISNASFKDALLLLHDKENLYFE